MEVVDAINLVSGINAGVAVVLAGQPLDTVKVKLQTFPQSYTNAFQCFWRTAKNEGIFLGLYAGTVPSLVANVADNAVLFLFYGLCQRFVAFLINKKPEDLPLIGQACAGGITGIFTSLVLCPIEMIKCRLQAQYEVINQAVARGSLEFIDKQGPWGLTKDVLREEGVRGLFKGLSATLLREIPGYFAFFFGIEVTRKLFTERRGKKLEDLSLLGAATAGAAGGACLWLTAYPFDSVKSRIQVECQPGIPSPRFHTMFFQMLRQEGVRSLYKGFGPTMVRVFPANAALYLAYDLTKRHLTSFTDKYTGRDTSSSPS